MPSSALRPSVSAGEWMAAVDRCGWAEVVDGRLVVMGEQELSVAGDNRHDIVARRLANALEFSWGLPVSAPARWELRGGADAVQIGRVPDLLVGDETLFEQGPFRGSPVVVGEVWSPTNTFGEITRKRREYHEAGAQSLVEASVDEFGTVSITWFVRTEAPQRWAQHASATGRATLAVTVPHPFEVVPDSLLHVPQSRR